MEKENKNLELEDIERDLYLRTLLTGERLGPLTGKPSIDRPWLINYSNEEIASIIPKRRIYMDLVESSKSFREDTSIEYYNNKITYAELIKNIDKAAISVNIYFFISYLHFYYTFFIVCCKDYSFIFSKSSHFVWSSTLFLLIYDIYAS